MSGGDHAGTPCPSCGAKYRWKPELAARKIHCAKCGDTIRMPAEAGGAATLVRKAETAAAKAPRKTPPPTPESAAAPEDDLPVLGEETVPTTDAPPPGTQESLEGPDVFATTDSPDGDSGASPDEDLKATGAADSEANIYDLAGVDEPAQAAPPAPAPPAPKAAPSKGPPPPKKAGKGGTPKADESPSCPSCGNPVKPGAVICLNCGFNIAAGSKIKTEVEASDVAGEKTGVLSRIKGLLTRRSKPSKGAAKD